MGPGPNEIAALIGMVNQGLLAQAEEHARALIRTYPTDGMLWKVLSVVLLRQDKDAMAALRRATELLPRDAEVHANLGAELRARGKWDEALASLRQSLALDPRNTDALIDAGDVQRSRGYPREAVVLYEEALRLDPARRDAHNNRGNAYLELGEIAEAARCYRRALQLGPDNAQILCNLGNALRQLGETDDAITCSRRAIELAPGLSMAHNNLGLLLAGRGERAAAIGSYREALRYHPSYIEALGNLGNALREVGQLGEALAAHQRALELDPARADGHSCLGYVLLDCRRTDEAAESFRNALRLNGEHVAAQLGLATALRIQGKPEEAQASCQAALALAPRRADVLLLLGELHADRGQFTQAQELFAQALEADSKCAPVYSSMAVHRRMTRDDTAWLRGAEALLAERLPVDYEINLRFAIGKYFDDIGEYDKAFTSHRAANELRKQSGRHYDRARLSAQVDRIITWCKRAAAPGWPRESGNSERPVFIIGMPRSGTSLAEQIVASHPAVFGAGEVRFWNRAFERLERAPADQDLGASFASVSQEYLQRVSAPAGAALRITDKLPGNFLYAGVIQRVFPRARFIHMQRHPLDTCLSVYFQNFFNVGQYANDLSDLAHYYGEYQRIMSHWRSSLPQETLLDVPYEDLVTDTESWARRMLEFINLPWDPRCLEFHRTDRVVLTASKWQVRQKITTGSVGRWRNYEKHLAPLRHLTAAENER
jgi:tetratricopeptide (TPR) repeat protein